MLLCDLGSNNHPIKITGIHKQWKDVTFILKQTGRVTEKPALRHAVRVNQHIVFTLNTGTP